MRKRTYVAIDLNGNATAIVKAESNNEAESWAIGKLPGFIGCLESRSGSADDVDALLMKVYRKAGMSESDAKLKVLARNSSVRTYDLEELCKAQTFASGQQPTSEDVDSILREGGLLPQRRDKKKAQRTSTTTDSHDEARLESAFTGMGLSETKAKTAARGRR